MASASIIIVAYNSADVLPACLASLGTTGAEIVVIDNGSEDASAAVAREHGAIVVRNPANRGLASAANQAAGIASGDYLLFLNPDTALVEGFDQLTGALLRDPGAAAAGGLLLDAEGRVQHEYLPRSLPGFLALAFEVLLINRLWPGNPVNRAYRPRRLPLDRVSEVEQPAGACLLVRRAALERAGGWDERFFPLWFEDVDLCARLRAAGFRILFCPASRWRHAGAHSLARISFAEKQIFWYRNLLHYVRKHMGSAAAPAMRVLVCAGASVRLAAALLGLGGRCSSRKAVGQGYRAVITLALTGNLKSEPPDVGLNATTR